MLQFVMSGSKIKKITALEMLDSRGNPTIKTYCELENSIVGCAMVPSGASVGSKEALEKRDGDSARYLGKGVQSAISSTNTQISKLLSGQDSGDQNLLDKMLCDADGTKDKSNFGGNAILGASLSAMHASSLDRGMSLYKYINLLASIEKPENKWLLPTPLVNILNGGCHASNKLSIQEFMIVPVGAQTFGEALMWSSCVYHSLKKILSAKDLSIGLGDEGGFAPAVSNTKDALDLLVNAIEDAGYKAGHEISLALDCAASEFYENGKYHIDGHELSPQDLIAMYKDLSNEYPIISIEDGCSEYDKEGWKSLNSALGNKIMIVGDDLYCTNKAVLVDGIENAYSNAILIKLNQVGTVTETLETIKEAFANKHKVIVSHRSGETCDTTIADLSVGTSAGFIKTGATARGERTAKYNRLLEIESQINEKSAQETIFNPS